MRVRLSRRQRIPLNKRHVAGAGTNTCEHDLGRKLKETLAQQRVLVIVQSNRAEKYRCTVRQLVMSLLLRLGFENDDVTDLVFGHATLVSVDRRRRRRRHTGFDRPPQLTHALQNLLELVEQHLHDVETTFNFDHPPEKRIVSHAGMSSGSNSARSSSAGPSLPSDIIGITRKCWRSTFHETIDRPDGPRSPGGPAIPRAPCFAASCQSSPGHGPGSFFLATNEPPSFATISLTLYLPCGVQVPRIFRANASSIAAFVSLRTSRCNPAMSSANRAKR